MGAPARQPTCVVTGANGFLGRALSATAAARGYRVKGAVRRAVSDLPNGVEAVVAGDLTLDSDWSHVLAGGDVIVHTAARVHVRSEPGTEALAAFRRVNVDGTLRLARQAACSGVRRFVFVSSIGVNGAETFESPFTASDPPAPHSPYAVSKLEAEVGLQGIARETGMEVVIIRPPLVYGPAAPGNFHTLLQYIYRGIPLPLGSIDNRRSLVAVDNLVDLMLTCLHHPAAANQLLLVSDGDDLSTSDLLRRVAGVLGRPARLLPVPAGALRAAARLAGQGELAQRLCGSLQVDITKTRQTLGWTPPMTVDQALSKSAQHFLAKLPQ